MTSKTTVNMVVGLLGLALLACIGGAIALTATHDHVPEQMWTIGSTALGALAAVLVSTHSGDVAQPVNVVNAPENPVPVDSAPEVIRNVPDGSQGTTGASQGDPALPPAEPVPYPT